MRLPAASGRAELIHLEAPADPGVARETEFDQWMIVGVDQAR
jgi:hypothetical protein